MLEPHPGSVRSPLKIVLYSLISEAQANRLQAPRIVFTMAAGASTRVTRARVIRARRGVRKLRFEETTHSRSLRCLSIGTEE